MEPDTATPEITLDQSKALIQKLNAKNEELSSDLEDCREQLFNLLQKENDIAEQPISDAFSRIFEGIDSWIDEVSANENFEMGFKSLYKKNLTHGKEDKFRSLGLPQCCLEIDWLVKLGELETCRYVVLTLVILPTLKKIFQVGKHCDSGNIYPVGMATSQLEVLEEVQRAMLSNEHLNDPYEIGRWRRQAVIALSSTERFKEKSLKVKSDSQRHLKTALQTWMDDKVLDMHWVSLESKVLQRAYQALELLSRSSKTYMPMYENLQQQSALGTLESNIIKDIATWRRISPDEESGVLLCLNFGLLRRSEEKEEEAVLVQPVLLGYGSANMQPKPYTAAAEPRKKSESQRARRNKSATNSPSGAVKPQRKRSKSPPKRHLEMQGPSAPPPPQQSQTQTPKAGLMESMSNLMGLGSQAAWIAPKTGSRGSSRKSTFDKLFKSRNPEPGSYSYSGDSVETPESAPPPKTQDSSYTTRRRDSPAETYERGYPENSGYDEYGHPIVRYIPVEDARQMAGLQNRDDYDGTQTR